MVVRANNAGDMEVYINTDKIINIYQVENNLYNVYLEGDKTAQIDGKTLRQIVRDTQVNG